jgi:hypothetical protein
MSLTISGAAGRVAASHRIHGARAELARLAPRRAPAAGRRAAVPSAAQAAPHRDRIDAAHDPLGRMIDALSARASRMAVFLLGMIGAASGGRRSTPPP